MQVLLSRSCSSSRAPGRSFGSSTPRRGAPICALMLRCTVLACLPATVFAQAAGSQSDGSQTDDCSIFNPIPDNQMRSFSTDRPTKSNVPYTVDCGHLQYETDLVNDSYQESGGIETDVLLAPNPTVKLGVTANADLELNIAPFERIRIRGPGGRITTVSGQGDLFARLKVNLWGDDGGSSAFALIPYIKAPTAASGVGNGAVEGGLIAPLALSLPEGVTLLINSELDALKNAEQPGHHVNYLNLINLSRTFMGNLTAYAELWSDVNSEPAGTVRQFSFDTALAWVPRPNLQLDIGVNAGLNSATPSYQVYIGASQRF